MIFKTKKEKEYIFIERGEGRPMVLLHGLMGGLSNFEEMVHFFAEKNFKVYVPQLPIYDLPILSTNLSSIAKFIAKFINKKIGKPVTIVGNSMGGHIGLILALSNPELLNSLVLTGSSGLYEKSFGNSFPRKNDKEYIKKKIQEVFYDPSFATNELVEEVFKIINDRMKGIKTLILARNAIKQNLQKEMPNIKCPTCIIWGKQDNVTPPNVAIEMNKLIPNSDLFWIDKCGHAAMMEKPNEFNNLLINWLNKIKT